MAVREEWLHAVEVPHTKSRAPRIAAAVIFRICLCAPTLAASRSMTSPWIRVDVKHHQPFGRTDFLDGDIERSRLRPCKQALSVCAACLGSAVRSVSWHASGTLRTSCPIDLGVSARERPGRGTQCACHGPLTHGVPPSQCSFTRGPTLGHRHDDEAELCQRLEYRSICCIHRRKHPLMIAGRRCGKVRQVRISR